MDWKGRGGRRSGAAGGYTLIEAMITVVVLGLAVYVLSNAQWLTSPGLGASSALRLENATAELVKAQQDVLATPFDELAEEVHLEHAKAGRRVEAVEAGLLRVTLEQRWTVGDAEQSLTLVTLRGDRP